MRSVWNGVGQTLFTGRPIISYDDEKSLLENFNAMCDNKLFSFLNKQSEETAQLTNVLKACGSLHNLAYFYDQNPAHIERDTTNSIQNEILHDIAKIQLTKLALKHWFLQNSGKHNSAKEEFVDQYKNEIESRQQSLHRLYNNVHKLQWKPSYQFDTYHLSHLWQTNEGLLQLRDSLEDKALQKMFDTLGEKITALQYTNDSFKYVSRGTGF